MVLSDPLVASMQEACSVIRFKNTLSGDNFSEQIGKSGVFTG